MEWPTLASFRHLWMQIFWNRMKGCKLKTWSKQGSASKTSFYLSDMALIRKMGFQNRTDKYITSELTPPQRFSRISKPCLHLILFNVLAFFMHLKLSLLHLMLYLHSRWDFVSYHSWQLGPSISQSSLPYGYTQLSISRVH